MRVQENTPVQFSQRNNLLAIEWAFVVIAVDKHTIIHYQMFLISLGTCLGYIIHKLTTYAHNKAGKKMAVITL